MKSGFFSLLVLITSITCQNYANAQYCTPLYGFQINSASEQVFSVKVDGLTGFAEIFSTIGGSDGVISSALNINGELIYYIEASIPRILTINSVDGEPLSSGIFNGDGLKELEYNCSDKIVYGFRESENRIDLVSINWQVSEIDFIFRFSTNNSEIISSAINAKGDLIFLLTGDNVLHTYNLTTGEERSEMLNVSPIEIEYDINDNLIYAYTENGAFGSIENGTFTQIGDIIEPQGEPISTAFDPFTNTFFIANNTQLQAIDALTGDIIDEFSLSEPLYRLNAGIPCEIVADFSPDNTCIDLPVQFTDTSVGATEWMWDFGDGIGTSTEQNPTYSYATAGNYIVTLQVSGCDLGVDNISKEISITEQPEVDLGPDIMACGKSYRINPGNFDPSFDLSWTFGAAAPTFNVTQDGTYFLSVKNGSCFGTDTIEVMLLETAEVDLGEDLSFCGPINVEFDAENPTLDIAWSTGETSPTITVNDAGIYWVDVTNDFCTTRDSVTIDFFDALALDIGEDVEICAESYELDAGISGPSIEYLWSNGETTQTIKVTDSGTYSVKVSTGTCEGTDEINVNFVNNISASLGEDINACIGDNIILDAGANADSYLWNEGTATQTLIVTETGDYSVEILNEGCRSIASIAVSFNETPTVMLPEDISSCADTNVVLTAPEGNNYQYEWSTGETTQTIVVNSTANYSVEVDIAGCKASDDIRVTINPLPEVNLGEDRSICLVENETAILNPGESFRQYTWSTGEESATIEITRPGTFSVMVEDNKGCINSDEIMVIEQCNAQVYMPNAFSPNGDGQNDNFKPTVKFIENYTFKVFNRFGEVVFSTRDMDAAWDGVYKNLKQPIGVFSWVVEYTPEGGETQKKKGNVTLIR